MKLAHFALDTPFTWQEDNICTLVLENNKFYRDTITKLIEQSSTGVGDFTLSESNEVLAFDKYVEVISDVFVADASINKSIISGLQKELSNHARFEMAEEWIEIFGQLNRLISRLSYGSDVDVAFDDINDVSALLKLYRLRPDCDNLCFSEKIIMYMDLLRKYCKKQLFVVVNIKACFTDEELDCFYRDVIYHKLNLLCIEHHDSRLSHYEIKKILDSDMCEL